MAASVESPCLYVVLSNLYTESADLYVTVIMD